MNLILSFICEEPILFGTHHMDLVGGKKDEGHSAQNIKLDLESSYFILLMSWWINFFFALSCVLVMGSHFFLGSLNWLGCVYFWPFSFPQAILWWAQMNYIGMSDWDIRIPKEPQGGPIMTPMGYLWPYIRTAWHLYWEAIISHIQV